MRELDLDRLVLSAGAHPDRDGMCVMEAAAWVAGEEWSDRPKCASPVVGAFMRSWNDRAGITDRQRLKRWIVPMVGSRGNDLVELRRGWMVLDWLVRELTPQVLVYSWLETAAGVLVECPEIVGLSRLGGAVAAIDLASDLSGFDESDSSPILSAGFPLMVAAMSAIRMVGLGCDEYLNLRPVFDGVKRLVAPCGVPGIERVGQDSAHGLIGRLLEVV